jgi:transglutaminase-like putative cysteine protease
MKPAPWNDQVVGIYRQQRLFQEKDTKPGDEFSYQSFEPSINLVVNAMVKARDYEEVELFGGKQKKRLLRVESRAEKVQGVQLPVLVAWLGDDLMPMRSEAEVPGLGKVTLYRTTKAVALSPGQLAKITDIGTSQHVKLGKKIPRPYETTSALYRITIRDDDEPASAFSRDERQEVKKVQGKTIELLVKASNGLNGAEGKKPGEEFSQSSYFINSNDSKVKELAKKAVGAETDSWKKALAIEKWVHDHMKATSQEALAPADHVARTLTGDCTEYAMLTAAMCRAESIPSRTAVGLVYADVRGGPVFAFHMWTEVSVKGRWLPIDATLGQGRVGATHLKVTDQSWHDTYDQTPLLPVLRVLGRLSIEVLRVEGR